MFGNATNNMHDRQHFEHIKRGENGVISQNEYQSRGFYLTLDSRLNLQVVDAQMCYLFCV